MSRHPYPTQRSAVHVADKARPNDVELWRLLTSDPEMQTLEPYAWLCCESLPYWTGCDEWPEEEGDLSALSEAFPGTLFVSNSVATSKPDTGTVWRVFALDGEAWRSIPTDGVWAPPILSGLPGGMTCPHCRASRKIGFREGAAGRYVGWFCPDCDDTDVWTLGRPDEDAPF